jgi:Na+-transporting NADH:ubiquinone oxidoreductase subunit C
VQQSNTYIIVFALCLTFTLGAVLSGASVLLKDKQDAQVLFDTKKKILGAVEDISGIKDRSVIEQRYDSKVMSIVVDFNGNLVEKDSKGNPVSAEKINIQKNHKVSKEDRLYPVFIYKDENGNPDAYIFPMFGAGLWDWISGYVALDNDLNTIRGVAFDHKSETPGLGARITDDAVRNRYKGTQIYEGNQLVSVTMVKGEGNKGLNNHQVDGMSGATLTGKGVNQMLGYYLECYQGYINKTKSNL